MAPLPPVSNVVKLENLWTQDGLPAANVIHVGYSSDPPSAADVTSLCEAWGTAIMLEVGADFPTTTSLVAVQGTDLSSDTGAVGIYNFNIKGTAEDPASPPQCCVLTNWQIARRYRGGHPRTYWPAPANGAYVPPNQWESSVLTDFNSLASDLMLDTAIATYGALVTTGLVSVSYVDAGAPRVDPIVDPIIGFSTSGLTRTQRRRVTSSSY